MQAKVTANENAITKLNADDSTAGSVDKKIKDALAAFEAMTEQEINAICV